MYRTRGPGGNGAGAVRVGELEAESGPAAAALWSYLVSIDLTSTVEIAGRPADDPLLHLAADRDQVRVTGQEPALWLRLLDVRAALTARSWAAPVDLVVDLRDTVLPANAGRFRLTAGPGGATWEPAGEAPDISLDVRELGSCYLGAPAAALRPRRPGHRAHPGAVRRLDAALETEWLPFTGENY
ncbi:sterol carrier protein domain-containing protein [Streptomyces lydicus]|nr:sterol carrier protein domain-containing protein [Streptomyces lydicus]